MPALGGAMMNFSGISHACSAFRSSSKSSWVWTANNWKSSENVNIKIDGRKVKRQVGRSTTPAFLLKIETGNPAHLGQRSIYIAINFRGSHVTLRTCMSSSWLLGTDISVAILNVHFCSHMSVRGSNVDQELAGEPQYINHLQTSQCVPNFQSPTRAIFTVNLAFLISVNNLSKDRVDSFEMLLWSVQRTSIQPRADTLNVLLRLVISECAMGNPTIYFSQVRRRRAVWIKKTSWGNPSRTLHALEFSAGFKTWSVCYEPERKMKDEQESLLLPSLQDQKLKERYEIVRQWYREKEGYIQVY